MAQVQSSPGQHPGNDWAEEWLADAQIGGGCAAEISGNQNRA
jgi:hypothetical protein